MREETRCRHMGYSFQLTARVLLYAPSHRQDSTYHSLWYTSRGALAGTRNSSMGPPHEGSIRRPIAPWANALTTELHLAPRQHGWNRLSPNATLAMRPVQGKKCVKNRITVSLCVNATGSDKLKPLVIVKAWLTWVGKGNNSWLQ